MSLTANVKPISADPSRALYTTVLLIWALSVWWFHSRLMQLIDIADTWAGYLAIGFFIIFVELAWLYGFYNIGVVTFAWITSRFGKRQPVVDLPDHKLPAVALLYTTCNDFVEESVESCVNQDYPNYTVYILDDSSKPEFQKKVDDFSFRHMDRVKVVRRKERKGFKAGNLNHGLQYGTEYEPYFAIADADEILPTDFLRKIMPVIESDKNCGFVQANHRSNPKMQSSLAESMGIGIDSHWKWYQPLRNRFGFVMFLGHGAVLRREAWAKIGGFPEIVSEDLGFAIRARELGYRGYFMEDVVCYEDFPETIRAFRIRHMKWTRGTCEFLAHEGARLVKAKRMTWAEKLDILFPTMNLPLSLFYFLFMIDANFIMPALFGRSQPLTVAMSGKEFVLPFLALDERFSVIFTGDFFAITILTFFAPILCFILDMWRDPIRLMRFLSHSTAVYAALSPLSAIGVLSFLFTGKATFLVTGDNSKWNQVAERSRSIWQKAKKSTKDFLHLSHPDQLSVQAFEIAVGGLLAVTCIFLMQISFFGLSLGFVLFPLMHHLSWENPMIQKMVYLPFGIILLGVGVGMMSLFGIQPVFFGYGFHF